MFFAARGKCKVNVSSISQCNEISDCSHEELMIDMIDYRNTPAEVPPPKSAVKVELQVLRLSDDSQKYVMNTLRSIHGEDFKLKDRSKYKDKGGNLKKGYWEDRGTLLVQVIESLSILAKILTIFSHSF